MSLQQALCCRLCASVWKESCSIWLSGSDDVTPREGTNERPAKKRKKKGGSFGRQREKRRRGGEVSKMLKNGTSVFASDNWTDADRCCCLCECVCERQTNGASEQCVRDFPTKQYDMLSHLPEVHVLVFFVSLFKCVTLLFLVLLVCVFNYLCLHQSFTSYTSPCLL